MLGFVLGTVLALMRLSRNPLLRGVSWTYIWIFRSVPLICKPFETDEMKSALAAMLDRSLSALVPGASPAARPN